MKETGLLFTGEMVRAKLEGRKTQTRRIVKPQPEHNTDCPYHIGEGMDRKARICPYGQPGDRIWVRERQRVVLTANDNSEIMVEYEADGTMSHLLPYPARLKWVPEVGLHLPYGGYRESSRITLEIVNIRVERLQEISEEDAIAEGVTPSIVGDDLDHLRFRAGFQTLWDSMYAKKGHGWDTNPCVRVIEFKEVRG